MILMNHKVFYEITLQPFYILYSLQTLNAILNLLQNSSLKAPYIA